MKEDFSDCNFIDYEFTFYTYTEFCKKCNRIKHRYQKLNPRQKEFYHYYIYANQHMSQTYKDRIQEYLNDDCTEWDLKNIIKFYKPRDMPIKKK